MKLEKRLIALFCAAALLGGAGCSDGDEASYRQSDLIGTWQKTKLYDDRWIEENSRLIFRGDGTGEDAWEDDGQRGSDSFTYALQGNVLTIDYDGYPTTQYIAKLTRSELVITDKDRTRKAFFKRVTP